MMIRAYYNGFLSECEEVKKLEAEVASLKEESVKDVQRYDDANKHYQERIQYWMKENASLKDELAATQSVGLRYARENDDLARRLEKYRVALQQVIVLDQPKYNYGNCADVARAALSDLPEADKEKS